MKSSRSDSKKNQETYLLDMLTAARQVMRYVEGVSFDAFWDNCEKRDAVAMQLSVLGEAASHLSPETIALIPKVPIREIRGMRNRVVHEYQSINYRIVWQVTQSDIQPLVTALEEHFSQTQRLSTTAETEVLRPEKKQTKPSGRSKNQGSKGR